MLAKLYSGTLFGIDAFCNTIEVSVSNGIGYQITGLPDDAIKESLSRIAIAISSNGYHMPRNKLVINLAPAGIRKAGTTFDLPITIGILIASEQIADLGKLQDYLLAGEIGLDGSIYSIHGAMCMAAKAKCDGFRGIVVPAANAKEASLIKGINVFAVDHLREVINFINGDCHMEPVKPLSDLVRLKPAHVLDFKDVRGQGHIKRALEIAAVGGHNALLIGSPGTGKTMLAKRLPSILPPMTISEALETTRIHSVINHGEALSKLITERPFRQPHHSASDVALAGGGSIPMPGEISLAHNGVLFLDELPEFKRSAIEILRQPLEDRKILITRTKMSLEFPASFMLLAAMNPCICGYLGHPTRDCTCNKTAIYWYRRRISGPLMDRIDLHIEADPVPLEELIGKNILAESSASIRERVVIAREIQSRRYKSMQGVYCNAHMPDRDMEKHCPVEEAAKKYLFKTMNQLQLSARSYSRILKVSRSIADLAGRETIELSHIAEAVHFRALDKPLVIPDHRNKSNNIINKYPYAV